MTISSSTRKAGPFLGSDSAATFPFTFKVFTAADLLVVVSDGDTETELVLTTDYTVSLNADQNASPGGEITLTAGVLAMGHSLVITSAIAPTQLTDLTNQGGFYPRVITDAFDRLTILVQQIEQKVARALKLPLSDTELPPDLPGPPTARADKLLGFDADGMPVLRFAPPEVTWTLFGEVISTAAQVLFAVPRYVPGSNTLMVIRGGVVLTNGLDYTETSTTSITLTSGAEEGEIFVFRALAVAVIDPYSVHKTGDETIAGTKTFSSAIVGSLTGATAGTHTGPVIGAVTGTASGNIPTFVEKRGSGLGAYSHTGDISYADIDGTNLSYTVTIPTGHVLMVSASGTSWTDTDADAYSISLFDGSTEVITESELAGVALKPTAFYVSALIVGDGAAHTIKLRFQISNAIKTVAVGNSGKNVPVMTFQLVRSN